MDFEILPGEKYLHDTRRPLIWLGEIAKWQAELIGIFLIYAPIFLLLMLNDKSYYPYLEGWLVCTIYHMFLSHINFNYEPERGA